MLAGRCTIGVGGGGGNSLNCMVQEGSRGAWSKWPRLTAARTATRLKRPARLHGAALWKTPRRVGAEQRPLRCLPAVADSHRLCPCRRDRAWSALRSSSTGHAGALLLPRRHHHHARQEHRTRPWCGWRAGRRPCGSMVKVPPPLGSARARLPFHPRARLAAVAGAALQEAAGTRGAQPLPRVLEPATSKAAHFPALGPLSVS